MIFAGLYYGQIRIYRKPYNLTELHKAPERPHKANQSIVIIDNSGGKFSLDKHCRNHSKVCKHPRGLGLNPLRRRLLSGGTILRHGPQFEIPTTRGVTMKSFGRWGKSLLVFGLLTFAVSMHAQFTDGDIAGTVTDPSGATIIGATVTITSLQTAHVDQTQTDKIGYYRVHHLPLALTGSGSRRLVLR